MRLRRVRLPAGGGLSVAVLHSERWVPLAPALEQVDRSRFPELGDAARDVVAFLAGADRVREQALEVADAVAGADLSFDDTPLLPFEPRSFRDFSLWEGHMIDAARGLTAFLSPPAKQVVHGWERITGRPLPKLKPGDVWYDRPIYYLGNHLSFLPDGAEIPWPGYSGVLDYELEIGAVIAAPVHDATPAEALAAVGGLVVVNDWTARDVQVPEMTQGLFGPMKAKNFATSMSAEVVTADEVLADLEQLGVAVRVNGTLWAEGTTAGMHHPLGEAVAYASMGAGLTPGELLATGTVHGCSGVEIGRWIGPGDVVSLEVERIGTLDNRVGHPPLEREGIAGTAWHRPGVYVLPGAAPDPDPAAWAPPPAPDRTGTWASNELLDRAERWPVPGVGPEDVAFDAEGRMYAGLDDGRILRFPTGSPDPEVIADTRGRPLGLEVDADGRLVVCDADRGLLRVPEPGRVEVLCDAFEGRRLRFTNNADIAADGTIYFSESSSRFGQTHYRQDFVEHRPNGSVFAYDPDAGEVRLLLDGLYFANGVALGPDESFVLVVETGRYRITRLWLTGEQAGRREVFVDNLPGFPDNMSRGERGLFWLALPRPRDPLVDRLLPRAGLRGRLFRIPEPLQPDPSRTSIVAGLDADGRVVHQLQGPNVVYGYITGVREHDGWLYLGSLEEPAVARVRVPA